MIKSLIEDIVTPYFAEEQVNKESLLQELNTNLTITDLESLNKENIHLKEVIEEAVEKLMLFMMKGKNNRSRRVKRVRKSSNIKNS